MQESKHICTYTVYTSSGTDYKSIHCTIGLLNQYYHQGLEFTS